MRFQVYRDSSGQWRWRLVGANNKIVADCAESYTRRHSCIRALGKVCAGVAEAATAEIEFVERKKGTDA